MTDLAIVTHVLVTSHLDYCTVLYLSAFEECLETSASSKCYSKTAAWCWLQEKYYSLITTVLQMPVSAQFKMPVMTFKALYSQAPGCFKYSTTLYEPCLLIRSFGEDFLSVQSPSQTCLVRTLEEEPSLWLFSGHGIH